MGKYLVIGIICSGLASAYFAHAGYYDHKDGKRYYCSLDEELISSSCSVPSETFVCNKDGATIYKSGCSISCDVGEKAICNAPSFEQASGHGNCQSWNGICRCY